MSVFQTEFQIRNSIRVEEFEDLLIEWVQGMRSTNLASRIKGLVDCEDTWQVKDQSGESATYQKVPVSGGFIAGFRHALPYEAQRLWRTEVVFRNTGPEAALGVRSHCLATDLSGRVRSPKRPFFLKLALKNSWPAHSASMPIADTPSHARLAEMDQVATCMMGSEDLTLPFVYISRNDENQLALDPEKLAYDLGGLAHVVVEPSRAASFKLMNLTSGRNPYGGTIGVSVRGSGIIKRFFLGYDIVDGTELGRTVVAFVTTLVSTKALILGCEWQSLQEARTEFARSQVGTASSAELSRFMDAFDQENHDLKAENQRLQSEIQALIKAGIAAQSDDPQSDQQTRTVAELYPGETIDRLRVGIGEVLRFNANLSDRTKFVLQELLKVHEFSGGARSLFDQIRFAGRDTSEMPGRMTEILLSLGFARREDGKHMVFTAPETLGGIGPITVPKTPGDYRAGKNMASDVLAVLALNEVKGGSR